MTFDFVERPMSGVVIEAVGRRYENRCHFQGIEKIVFGLCEQTID